MNLNMHPFCLDVEVTSRCNVGCRHCYLGKPGECDMSVATADMVLQYLEREGAFHPDWKERELNLYGGEPFLNFPIVQYLVERAKFTRFTIFTNGATALPWQVEWCIAHQVSPKRSTAGCLEAAALTRPGDGYHNRWLAEGRLWQDYACPRRLTVTPETARYVVRSVAWLHSRGYYGPVDLATDDYAAWPTEARTAYAAQLQELAYLVIREFQGGRVLAIENFQNFGRALFAQPGVRVLGCGAGWNTQGISVDGRIVLCHRWFRDKSALSQTRLADTLAGQPIDFGEAFTARLADLCRMIEEPECIACSARDSCPHGCLHVSHVTCGALNRQPEARCWAIRLYDRLAREIHEALEPHDPKWWEAGPTRPVLE